MKSKIRKITVESNQYIWAVSEKEWHTVTIKVWVEGHKRNHWFEVLKKFDDPWINF
ncbi:hypothetical protein C8D91_2943 [Marinicella litoralis]|uniref:Uncharacterized protein n=1 Tax=Marinicella litoralis TaxID=644220 RepID=A0A4R6X6F1_9GAMM|nr:hypothetical protein C8D91_2943 [Marinicella litoralis]